LCGSTALPSAASTFGNYLTVVGLEAVVDELLDDAGLARRPVPHDRNLALRLLAHWLCFLAMCVFVANIANNPLLVPQLLPPKSGALEATMAKKNGKRKKMALERGERRRE
jgi:hypothetical protein